MIYNSPKPLLQYKGTSSQELENELLFIIGICLMIFGTILLFI